jgi:GMP synthase-like glutamine amidotransferase
VKPILFVRCDPLETFGTGPDAVAAAGASLTVWEAIDPAALRPAVTDHAGVVLFGSTFNVEHADEQPFIKDVADLTRESVERGVPFLGLCFGAQVLAWALDAEVSKAATREVGFEPIHVEPAAREDPVLAHYAEGDLVFHWHMDTFAPPDGGTLLATGERVRNQAFRVGDVAWATQFHAEIDAAEADAWVTAASAEEDVEQVWGKSPDRIRREIAAHMADHERRGRETFRRFVEVARDRAEGHAEERS